MNQYTEHSDSGCLVDYAQYNFLSRLVCVGEDGAKWGCGVRWGGAKMHYFRGDWVETLGLFPS